MRRSTWRGPVGRRGAPQAPKRRRSRTPVSASARSGQSSEGFETLIPRGDSESFFFPSWLADENRSTDDVSAGVVPPPGLEGNPRLAVSISAVAHVFLVLFLLIEPNLDFLNSDRDRATVVDPEKREPLMLFVEPPPEPPPQVAQAVPLPPVAEPPPAARDDGLLIPRASKPPPPDKIEDFLNDLPFSEGNTDEFYTDKELDEPGEEGDPGEAVEEKGAEGEETVAEEAAKEMADGKGDESIQKPLPDFSGFRLDQPQPPTPADARPAPADILPPNGRRGGEGGERGEGGAFEDISRFLRDKSFHNPEGGLVSNNSNTMYYNDKGANFVPWLRRMLTEVRKNWMVPYSAAFEAGHVAVGISVRRDGKLTELKILFPSGTSGFDNAAVGALRASNLLPLPSDYPDDNFDMILVFWYNEQPYDLFRR